MYIPHMLLSRFLETPKDLSQLIVNKDLTRTVIQYYQEPWVHPEPGPAILESDDSSYKPNSYALSIPTFYRPRTHFLTTPSLPHDRNAYGWSHHPWPHAFSYILLPATRPMRSILLTATLQTPPGPARHSGKSRPGLLRRLPLPFRRCVGTEKAFVG